MWKAFIVALDINIGYYFFSINITTRGLSGGSVVKNPPANAGDVSSILGPERSYMPWSN